MNSIPAAPTTRTASSTSATPQRRTGLGIADMALGLFTNYAEIGERAHQLAALATDIFVQDSWRPTTTSPLRRATATRSGSPGHSTTNNIANFGPRFYDEQRRR